MLLFFLWSSSVTQLLVAYLGHCCCFLKPTYITWEARYQGKWLFIGEYVVGGMGNLGLHFNEVSRSSQCAWLGSAMHDKELP